MQLTKIELVPDHAISYEIFCTQMPSATHLDVLIMKFSGVYGIGSKGNGDAQFMTAMTKAAISYTAPFGLIFDFTDLSYQWGDRMSDVILAGEHHWADAEMPFAIVVSDKCVEAMTSLLKVELDMDDLTLLHHTLTSALAYIDQAQKLSI